MNREERIISKAQAISALGSQLEALEAETFEVADYVQLDERALAWCSCTSTSGTSTSSTTG